MKRLSFVCILCITMVIIIGAQVDQREVRAWNRCRTMQENSNPNTLQEYKKFRNRYPQSDHIKDALWAIAELAPDYYECVSTYMLFIQNYPQEPRVAEAHWRLAQRYYLHSNYSEAEKHFTALIERFPDSPHFDEAHYWLGVIATERNRFVQAGEMFRYCIEHNTAWSHWARFGLAHTMHVQNNPEGAKTVYLGLCTVATDRELLVVALYELAQIYFRETNYSNALFCYDIIAGNFPLSIEGEKSKAQARLIRSRHSRLRPVSPEGLAFALDIAHEGTHQTAPSMAETPVAVNTSLPPPTNTVTEQTTADTASLPAGSYSVQVAAYRTRKKAKDLKHVLEIRSYENVYIMRAEVNETVWYRVRIGPCNSRAEAESLAAQIRSAERTEANVVRN